MSGVLMHGIQWEHCNQCGKYVPIREIIYERPTDAHEHGRSLCAECAS